MSEVLIPKWILFYSKFLIYHPRYLCICVSDVCDAPVSGRLHLFGRESTIRPGWLTVGPGLTSSNFDPDLYNGYFSGGNTTTGQCSTERSPSHTGRSSQTPHRRSTQSHTGRSSQTPHRRSTVHTELHSPLLSAVTPRSTD